MANVSGFIVCFAVLLVASSPACSRRDPETPEHAPPENPQAALPIAPEPTAPGLVAGSPGERLYAEHCAPCHGYTGRGDGPVASMLDNPPRGLVSDPWQTFDANTPDNERAGMRAVITEGLEPRGMPAFKDKLDTSEVDTIIERVLEMRAAAAGP